jgi:hypothetical protein
MSNLVGRNAFFGRGRCELCHLAQHGRPSLLDWRPRSIHQCIRQTRNMSTEVSPVEGERASLLSVSITNNDHFQAASPTQPVRVLPEGSQPRDGHDLSQIPPHRSHQSHESSQVDIIPAYLSSVRDQSAARSPTSSDVVPDSAKRPRNCALWMRWWGWELGACISSFAALLAICILLKAFDGKAQPDWPYEITINSAVSWLTATMKGMLLVPAAACISQSTWVHYASRQHNLETLVTFDSASRGPWGSAQLLWALRAR